MSTKNDITMVQRRICHRRGKEYQNDYLYQIGLGPDNDVGDAVPRLEGAGYEVNKIVGGIMFWLKATCDGGHQRPVVAGKGRES